MKNQKYSPKKVISVSNDRDHSTFVLQNGTKLSEVFTELPAGIINKTETGIGATTLELISRRNSIIVEPIRVTASSKANKRTTQLKLSPELGYADPGAIYVGSKTALHPSEISATEILAYHNKPGFKKIVVVADSLSKVIRAIGPSVQNEYFLMVDEADAFQMDSTYRNSMNTTVDYFKKFLPNNGALVTATMLDFSDPEINQLPKTLIRYNHPTSFDVRLIHSENLKGAAVKVIEDLTMKYPDDKVLVALNSPSECFNIATHLEKKQLVGPDEQAVLCSNKSKSEVGGYFHELDSDKLPKRVNYITSAYFSGFDIHEDLHVVSVSDGKSKVQALSEHKLKQIAGRCRETLLSHTVIYRNHPGSNLTLDKESLLEAARLEVKTLDCIHHHFGSSPVLKSNIKKLRTLLFSNDGGIRFARIDIDEKPVVSFLAIDAMIESQRVRRELYSISNGLESALVAAGNQVSSSDLDTRLKVADQNSKEQAQENEVNIVLERVQSLANHFAIGEVVKEPTWSPRQKMMLNILYEYSFFVNHEELVKLVEDAGRRGDIRKLKNLQTKLFLSTYDQETTYKKIVRDYFKVGNQYSPDDQLEQWNKVFTRAALSIKVKTTDQATKITAKHFEMSHQTRARIPTLLSENPLKITILRTRKDEPRSLKEILQTIAR